VGIQIKIIRIIQNETYSIKIKSAFKTIFYVTLVLTFVQILLGAQVRQEVDFMVKDSLHRSEWISNMKGDFYFHRSFSWVILACTALLFFLNNKWKIGIPTIKFMLVFVLIEFITGILFSYADMPSFTQPFHLLAATCLLGFQFYSLKYFQFKRDSI
jgi:cytochrome c oxidase assembly protein subunit 15